ncbi:MAG: diaminopimelate epimerase [Gemmatimonadaceae bacterium]|nr:diaminopimelate epimerase [Gemmatimonadaceae bacterium]
MAAALVGPDGSVLNVLDLSPLEGVPFTKMTGSGNDFVIFDARTSPTDLVTRPEVIASICNRNNGIGADGVVILEPPPPGDSTDPIRLRYFNRDGSLGELCGNATLCSTALSVQLGLAAPTAVRLNTDAGLVTARRELAHPEIDVAPVREVRDDLRGSLGAVAAEAIRSGFALVGVPHVVLLLPDRAALDAVAVAVDGPPIRQHASLAPAGANVNWVAPDGRGGWAYRTFERGVEGETLACGTGAIACAILLTRWGLAPGMATLETRSGRPVHVRLAPADGAPADLTGAVRPSLSGEGRVVFVGQIGRLVLDR